MNKIFEFFGMIFVMLLFSIPLMLFILTFSVVFKALTNYDIVKSLIQPLFN